MANDNLNFKFEANGGSFFVLMLKNALLTGITFGIYYFWAGVNITKYLYNNTSFLGGRFDYTATGKERFIAFLKGFGIIIVLVIASILLQKLLGLIFGASGAAVIVYIIILAALILVAPVLYVGTMRYRLSRTTWKEYNFRFTGKASELGMIMLKGIPLTIITFGIYGAWYICDLNAYIYKNTKIGKYNFDFDADGKEFFFLFLKGYLLTLVTFGIYGAWFIASLERFNWEHTSFQGKRFKSEVTGKDTFILLLTNMLLVVITLGIGYAWAFVRAQKYFLENTSITEEPDTAGISNVFDDQASPATEGFDNALSFLDTIADIIG